MQVTERMVTVSAGYRLHVVEFGAATGAPYVLFVHGSFGHARVWDFVASELPARFSAGAVDLPGHGDSDRPARADPYAFRHLVADLRAIVESAATAPVLVGHSLGSALAMFYAAQHPDTISAAVFMDIDPHPPDYQAQHLNRVGEAPPKHYPSFDRAVARESRIAPDAADGVAEHLAAHGYRATAKGWEQKFDQEFLRAVRTWDASRLLPKIAVPVLVLRGADSHVMSRDGYDQLLEGIANACGQEIDGAGHQLHLEQPVAVARAIARFCSEIPPRPGRVGPLGQGPRRG
jgi:pimeloyl-ACP methyl ester carboxylesterase